MCMRADVQHTRMDAHACSRSRAKTGLRALFDDGVAGVCHGRVERRLSIIVDGARVGARSQEQLNDLGVPRLRCCVEQTVLLRGVGAMIREEPHAVLALVIEKLQAVA